MSNAKINLVKWIPSSTGENKFQAGVFLDLLKTYFGIGTCTIDYKNTESRAEERTVVFGFPQVSIPEPLFLIFYINDLLNCFSNVESLLLVDDTNVLFDHPDCIL